MERVTQAFGRDFGWPGTFFSVNAARSARATLLSPAAGAEVRLIGLAVPAAYLEPFSSETAPPAHTDGFAPEGASGFHVMALRRLAPDPDGELLGYELLNIEHRQLQHSWLCNQLDQHCARVLGVRPNGEGLIDDVADAERCRDEISRADVGAEPGPWLPLALFEYDLRDA